MPKGRTRVQHSTWNKIFLLSSNGDDLDNEYGEILLTLIQYRIALGITQIDLSKRSGLSTSMISKLESQNTVPSFKTILKYLKGLGLSLEFIIAQKWVSLNLPLKLILRHLKNKKDINTLVIY